MSSERPDEDQMRHMGQQERRGIYDLNIRSRQLRFGPSTPRSETSYNFGGDSKLFHEEGKLF